VLFDMNFISGKLLSIDQNVMKTIGYYCKNGFSPKFTVLGIVLIICACTHTHTHILVFSGFICVGVSVCLLCGHPSFMALCESSE
jgi:hypothetical protein